MVRRGRVRSEMVEIVGGLLVQGLERGECAG